MADEDVTMAEVLAIIRMETAVSAVLLLACTRTPIIVLLVVE